MHARELTISRVFDSVKKEILPVNNPMAFLKMGVSAENVLNCPPELLIRRRLVEFIRKVAYEMCKENLTFLRGLCRSDEQLCNVIQRIIKAILTDIYKVGKCDEFACLSLVRLLKAGITDRIEVMAVNGFCALTGKPTDHVFLAIGRDRVIDIRGKFTKFDPWGEDLPFFYDGKSSLATWESLGAGAINKIKEEVKAIATWSRNLRWDDYYKIILFLEEAKKQVEEPLLSKAADVAGLAIDASQEKTAICQKIDEEIQYFRGVEEELKFKLLASFRVTHYDKPQAGMFGQEKGVRQAGLESSHAPENKVFRR